MLDSGYSTEYIGLVSTVFMITYGVGQLLNGMIGDRIKAKTGPPSVSFSALRKLPKNAIKGLQKTLIGNVNKVHHYPRGNPSFCVNLKLDSKMII